MKFTWDCVLPRECHLNPGCSVGITVGLEGIMEAFAPRSQDLLCNFGHRQLSNRVEHQIHQCYAGYQVLTGPFPAPKKGRPIFIAVVDVSAEAAFLELVKMAVSAAIEALPPNTLVGIITLSDCVRCLLSCLTQFKSAGFECYQQSDAVQKASMMSFMIPEGCHSRVECGIYLNVQTFCTSAGKYSFVLKPHAWIVFQSHVSCNFTSA